MNKPEYPVSRIQLNEGKVTVETQCFSVMI